MALNCRFIELHGPAPVPRSETGAGCASIPYGEEKLLYIATPGSDEKQSGAKPSQVLQLDRGRAEELKGDPRTDTLGNRGPLRPSLESVDPQLILARPR